jgi:copper chaperone CopZ
MVSLIQPPTIADGERKLQELRRFINPDTNKPFESLNSRAHPAYVCAALAIQRSHPSAQKGNGEPNYMGAARMYLAPDQQNANSARLIKGWVEKLEKLDHLKNQMTLATDLAELLDSRHLDRPILDDAPPSVLPSPPDTATAPSSNELEPEDGPVLSAPVLSAPILEPVLVITRIEVTGMCCQSEVTLINRKLSAMPGVGNIQVNLMTRQVAVTHDERTPPQKLVRTLNWSLLGASLVTGSSSVGIKRGGFNHEAALAAVCGLLWAASFGIWARDDDTEWYDDPFSYVALACIIIGSPVMLVRALSGVFYQRTVNMFATMCIATIGAVLLLDFWEAAAIVFFFASSEWLQAALCPAPRLSASARQLATHLLSPRPHKVVRHGCCCKFHRHGVPTTLL